MRLFVGIWPPEEWRGDLETAQHELRRRGPRGVLRLTPLDQIHLTLRFLGEVDGEQVAPMTLALVEALKDAAALRLKMTRLGAFPDPARPRVIWAGLTGDLPLAAALQQRVSRAVDPFAERPEDKAFHPHLTLARVREAGGSERQQLERAIDGVRLAETTAWLTTAVRVVRSVLRPEGAVYETVQEIPLATTR